MFSFGFTQAFLKKLKSGERPSRLDENKFIAKAGNVLATDSDGDTALMLSLRREYWDLALRLIEAGADVRLCDKEGFTPLIRTIQKEQWPMVALLLEKGADILAINKDGDTALTFAIWKGNRELSERLIKMGADVNTVTQNGSTPLTLAAEKEGFLDIVRLLVERSAKVNASNANGNSPLILALINCREDIASYLLEKGADIKAINKDGNTALAYAIGNGNRELSERLIEMGADVNTVNKFGSTPLTLACAEGWDALAKQFIERGANLEHRTEQDNTPLKIAAAKGQTDTVRMLLQNGAEIDAADPNGDTALNIALWNGHRETALLLLENGANIHTVPGDGMTPVNTAASKGFDDLVRLMIKDGADIDVKTKDGSAALALAAKNGHKDVEKTLMGVPYRVYTSEKWKLRFRYPRSWGGEMENDSAGSWSIPIAVASPSLDGGKSIFMVNAREGGILQGGPNFVVTQALSDGSFVDAPATPEAHHALSAQTLASSFDNLRFESHEEVRLPGGIPAMYEKYSYGAPGREVCEVSVTAYCKGAAFQFIYDIPANRQESYMPVLPEILASLSIGFEPVHAYWEKVGAAYKSFVPEERADSPHSVFARLWHEAQENERRQREEKERRQRRIVQPLQTSSPEEAARYLFDMALPAMESIPLRSVQVQYEGYEQSWRSNGLFRAGSAELRERVYPNLIKTCRQPGFRYYHIAMYDGNSRLTAMAFADGDGASVCIWRVEDQYYFCGNYFFNNSVINL